MTGNGPIRKSSLPCTPPADYEFHTVHGGQTDSPGVLLAPGDSGPVVVRRRVTYGDWEPVHPDHWADEAKATGGVYQGSALRDVGKGDVCRPVEVDGEPIRVRGQGKLSAEDEEALAALVRAAKAKFIADAPDQVGVLQNRLRLAHQARRAKEHQLDDIRRALCDAGFMNDDDPYSHADLADVIRQSKPTENTVPSEPTPADPDPKPYPITSPEWRSGDGRTRCEFRMNTGDGRLQCTFRAGHPPHGHSLNAANPGTPCPEAAPKEGTEGIDEVATALFELLSAFSPISSHNGTRLGWTLPMPVSEDDFSRWMSALTEGGA